MFLLHTKTPRGLVKPLIILLGGSDDAKEMHFWQTIGTRFFAGLAESGEANPPSSL